MSNGSGTSSTAVGTRTIHFGLRVSDRDRSLDFYRSLGYEVIGTVPGTEIGFLTMLKLPGDEFVTIELVSDPDELGCWLIHITLAKFCHTRRHHGRSRTTSAPGSIGGGTNWALTATNVAPLRASVVAVSNSGLVMVSTISPSRRP